MKLIYKPLFTNDRVAIPDLDGVIFSPGETSVDLTDEEAQYVLRNPNFVDAATGENPNYEMHPSGTVVSRSNPTAQPPPHVPEPAAAVSAE